MNGGVLKELLTQGAPTLAKSLGDVAGYLGAFGAKPAEALELSVDTWRAMAEREGSRTKAEQEASRLAKFKDQPEVLNFIINQIKKDPYWSKKEWGRGYLMTLLGQAPAIDPETLMPVERAREYTQEARILMEKLPFWREQLTPEAEKALTQALTPYAARQGYALEPIKPAGYELTPELTPEWQKFIEQIFGGPVPTAEEAAKAIVRGEKVPEPSPTYARAIQYREQGLDAVPQTQKPLAIALTEGSKRAEEFEPGSIYELVQNNPKLLNPDLMAKFGVLTPEQLKLYREGKEDKVKLDISQWENLDPEWIKKQPLLSKISMFIDLISTIPMDDRTMLYLFYHPVWFGGGPGTPAWVTAEMPEVEEPSIWK